MGRFPILPKAKQIQFLFIRLLVLASSPSGFLRSVANVSSLRSAPLPEFRAFLGLLLPLRLLRATLQPAAQLAPSLLQRKVGFCRSGSASLLPFQGLPPKACSSTLRPPPLPPWLLAKPKAASRSLPFGTKITETQI